MKSKTWSLFLSLVMMALMLPALQLRARAEEFEFNGLRYVYSSDYSSVYVVGYGEGLSADLIIPEEIEVDGTTYPISYIGSNAFENCTSLDSVKIPSSVESIGDLAFSSCTSLKSVIISEGVKSIGNTAFSSCTSLKSVTISEGVESIGGSAFENCISLESVMIPGSVENIWYAAFKDCTNLKSVTISEGVKSIIGSAFENCTSLKSVIISEGVKSIGISAFSSCTSLKSVTISEGVKSIGNMAFGGCTSLEFVTIPSSVESIGDFAFSSCDSLKSVVISEGVKSIGNSAFSNCTSLESVTIPSSVKVIGDGTFYGTKKLRLIFEPNSELESIDQNFINYPIDIYVSESDYERLKKLFENLYVNMIKYHLYAMDDVNESEITVSCVTRYGKIESATLKLAEPINLYYDKRPKEATLEGVEKFKALAGCKEDLKVDYYEKGTRCKLEGAPIEPGEYNAVVTYDGFRVSVTFKIKQEVIIGNFVYTLLSGGGEGFTADLCSYTGSLEENISNGLVEIPESVYYLGSRYRVTKIYNDAFYGCSFLKGLKVPRHVNYIAETTFKGCKNLKKVMFAPNSVLANNDSGYYLGKGMFDDTAAYKVEVCVHENSDNAAGMEAKFKDVDKIDYKAHEFGLEEATCKYSGKGYCHDDSNSCGDFEYNPLGHICDTQWNEDGKHIDECTREGCENEGGDEEENVSFIEDWNNDVYTRTCSKCEKCGVIVLLGPKNVFYDGKPKEAYVYLFEENKDILLKNGIKEEELKIDYYQIKDNNQGEIVSDNSLEKLKSTPMDIGKYEARLQIGKDYIRVRFEIKCDHSKSETGSKCTEKGKCSVCGKDMDAVGHVWSGWQSDAEKHWRECTRDGCSDKKYEEVHMYSDWQDGTKGQRMRKCAVCEKTEVCEHNDAQWKVLADGRSQKVCARCQKVMETCSHKTINWNSNTGKVKCTVCGYEKMCPHENYSWDSETGKKKCSTCQGVLETCSHKTINWDSGTGEGTCTVCKYVKTCPHENYIWYSETGKGTCTVCKYVKTCPHENYIWYSGTGEGKCTVCGYVKTCSHENYSWDSETGEKKCSTCQKVMETCSHKTINWDSGTGKGKCTVCGYGKTCLHENYSWDSETGEKKCSTCQRVLETCKHVGSTKWQMDFTEASSGIWLTCTVCKMKFEKCEHENVKWEDSDDYVRRKKCCKCGIELGLCYHPNCKWQINDTYHWKECSDCDGQISEIHDFDMSGSGKRDVRCKVCGYKLSVLGSCKDVYGITYELQSNGEAHMKEQDYARETIIIPEEVYDSVGKAYKVTRICGDALKFQNDVIKTVIISKNVNYIDRYAFAGCRGLERLVFLPGSAFSKKSSKKLSRYTFNHCNANVKVSFHEATNDVIKNMFSLAIGKNGSKLEFHSDYELRKPTCYNSGTLKCSNEEIWIPQSTHEWKVKKQTAISTVYRCVYCKKDFTVNTPKNNGDLFNTNLIDCLSKEDVTKVIGDTIEMKIEEKSVSQVEGASKNAMYFDITFTCGDGSKITKFEKPVKIKLSLGKHNPRGAELWCWHDGKPFKIKNFDVEEKNGKFWITFESKQFSVYEIRGVYYTIDDGEIIKNDDGSFTVKIKEDLSDRDEMRAESKLLQNILSSGSKVYIVDDKENKFEIIENSVDEDGKLMTLKFREVLLEDPIEVEQEEVNTTMDQVTDNFKTGDTNNIAFLITLMFLALTLGLLTVRKRKFEK